MIILVIAFYKTEPLEEISYKIRPSVLLYRSQMIIFPKVGEDYVPYTSLWPPLLTG